MYIIIVPTNEHWEMYFKRLVPDVCWPLFNELFRTLANLGKECIGAFVEPIDNYYCFTVTNKEHLQQVTIYFEFTDNTIIIKQVKPVALK